ncbi:hypothetical protein AwEntero_20490 [Enterobacterales bacterium]|nr:hypothetical protein AwEntero_20490 [Enterobacterales bacterium]
MINVEFFPVDKILNDQMLICVEGFSVDNLRILATVGRNLPDCSLINSISVSDNRTGRFVTLKGGKISCIPIDAVQCGVISCDSVNLSRYVDSY